MMKSQLVSGDEKISSTDANFYLESRPISQVEIQQKYVHLQTILMLTQLNSAYYEMHLSLNKTLTKLENKYFASKMKAFAVLRNYRSHSYEAIAKTKLRNCPEMWERFANQSEGLLSSESSTLSKAKSKLPIIIFQSYEQTTCKVFLKTKGALTKITKILKIKLANRICYGFYQLLKCSNQNSTLKILSDKSSKIQTIDSQKSKIFKRSAEKRVSRKSFSLEKSMTSQKNQYFVPIKYQAQNKMPTPQLSSNPSSIDQPKNEEGTLSELSKLLQKNADPLMKQRRNLLTAGRERKILKSTSSKKYNASLMSYGKEEKIKELQYLQRKYKKLISEFNWFSQRFLKVIEEQAI